MPTILFNSLFLISKGSGFEVSSKEREEKEEENYFFNFSNVFHLNFQRASENVIENNLNKSEFLLLLYYKPH